jgi:hypothetical protein
MEHCLKTENRPSLYPYRYCTLPYCTVLYRTVLYRRLVVRFYRTTQKKDLGTLGGTIVTVALHPGPPPALSTPPPSFPPFNSNVVKSKSPVESEVESEVASIPFHSIPFHSIPFLLRVQYAFYTAVERRAAAAASDLDSRCERC